MDGIKTKALLIKAIDYKENDKLLTLVSTDLGRITATIKGVKKAGGKLKYAASQFCFGEYILSERNGRYIVTGCDCIEPFAAIYTNLDKFYAGMVILEFLDKMLLDGDDARMELVLALKALNSLSKSGAERLITIRYLLSAFSIAGYNYRFDSCIICGKKSDSGYFSINDGGFVCNSCVDAYSIIYPLKKEHLNFLRLIENLSFDEMEAIMLDKANSLLTIFANCFNDITSKKCNSLLQFINISE